MMAEKELTINALPAKTWRWMKMNDSRVRWPEADASCTAVCESNTAASLSLTVPETGCGPETETLFADVSPLCFAAEKRPWCALT